MESYFQILVAKDKHSFFTVYGYAYGTISRITKILQFENNDLYRLLKAKVINENGEELQEYTSPFLMVRKQLESIFVQTLDENVAVKALHLLYPTEDNWLSPPVMGLLSRSIIVEFINVNNAINNELSILKHLFDEKSTKAKNHMMLGLCSSFPDEPLCPNCKQPVKAPYQHTSYVLGWNNEHHFFTCLSNKP
jgi:hypothetical protein